MKILIVDDQPNLARVTAIALRLLGCETLTAGTGAEASRILEAGNVDAVFLDVNLNGENGFELLTQFLARTSRLPVVMFTAEMLEDVAAEASTRGAIGCLVKPFGLDDLREQLARIQAHLKSPTLPPPQ